jgi:hypothetical protein
LAYRSRSSKAAISIGSWVQAPDEAWSSDIAYIRLAHGSVFLTVIMDWHSAGLAAYFRFYNEERFHETLGYRTPHEVYFGTPARLMPAAEAVV